MIIYNFISASENVIRLCRLTVARAACFLGRSVSREDKMRKMLTAAAGVLLAAMLPAPALAETCRTRASDAADVGNTITNFFATIERGDIPAARKMTTARFHAFDVGRHFGETELL